MATTKRYERFSRKQMQVMTWWHDDSPYKDKDAIICDGSVRSGKTQSMSVSFMLWAMSQFTGYKFGMAGKTIASFKRNVWNDLKPFLKKHNFQISKVPEMNDAYIVRKGTVVNEFYIFGGKDEASQDLVQGFTAAGFFFDEVGLMPESFVNQATARCSVEGAKLWFNCNPQGPFHWFKTGWIDNLSGKNAIRLHFLLKDNPSLSQKVRARYESMYTGVFYARYIEGLWVLAEGIIYSMFDDSSMVIDKVPDSVKIVKRWVGIDYGQSNATTFVLCGLGDDEKLYILDEYYHSGRESVVQKSPSRYSKDYMKWLIDNGVDGVPVQKEYTFIDPSAKGFAQQLHEDGERKVRKADNDVLKGIELVSSVIDSGRFRVLSHCKHVRGELSAYAWDPKAQERGEDKPIKQNDHCMDAIRYVVNGTNKIWKRTLRTRKAQTEDILAINRKNRA